MVLFLWEPAKDVFILLFFNNFLASFFQAALFTIDKYQPGPGTYDVIGVKNSLPKWKFSNSQRNVFISNKNPSPMEYTSLNSMVNFRFIFNLFFIKRFEF